ncbi:hypothetical protein RvY_10215 [Ramazzottius varieornatus]|uniref:WAP domain-containing protein n=1 Tax=Ramazzottius varieornatus TaxID=947166 RepID=A0A1D1VC22_RAMVA|nr:hypothetical protein RvY_10215 [Ramazzottius varieornatus]
MTSGSIIRGSLSLVLALSLLVSLPAAEGQNGAVLNNLHRLGAIRQSGNPCNGVNCGWGKYCAVINLANSNVQSYQCRMNPVTAAPNPPAVPVCYDKVEIRIPAGVSSSAAGVGSTIRASPCRNQCYNDNSCGGWGRICCMQGCDRICYMPKTSVVDYTG